MREKPKDAKYQTFGKSNMGKNISYSPEQVKWKLRSNQTQMEGNDGG